MQKKRSSIERTRKEDSNGINFTQNRVKLTQKLKNKKRRLNWVKPESNQVKIGQKSTDLMIWLAAWSTATGAWTMDPSAYHKPPLTTL